MVERTKTIKVRVTDDEDRMLKALRSARRSVERADPVARLPTRETQGTVSTGAFHDGSIGRPHSTRKKKGTSPRLFRQMSGSATD